MRKYMIDIDLPEDMTREFLALIPEQRKVVDNFVREGIIDNYTLSFDRKKLWIVMNTQNENTAMDILSTFPLIDFMKVDMHELAFHVNAENHKYSFSLN
jgi:muconolactone delta-isomerase